MTQIRPLYTRAVSTHIYIKPISVLTCIDISTLTTICAGLYIKRLSVLACMYLTLEMSGTKPGNDSLSPGFECPELLELLDTVLLS